MEPTNEPIIAPTEAPSILTAFPTIYPTLLPTISPTISPTKHPTDGGSMGVHDTTISILTSIDTDSEDKNGSFSEYLRVEYVVILLLSLLVLLLFCFFVFKRYKKTHIEAIESESQMSDSIGIEMRTMPSKDTNISIGTSGSALPNTSQNIDTEFEDMYGDQHQGEDEVNTTKGPDPIEYIREDEDEDEDEESDLYATSHGFVVESNSPGLTPMNKHTIGQKKHITNAPTPFQINENEEI